MEKTRRYDQEFKSGAVDLANKSDKPIAQIARELGIKPSLLYSWLKEKRKPKEVGIAIAHLQTQESMALLKQGYTYSFNRVIRRIKLMGLYSSDLT